jgi:hypothetical protein
MRSAELTVDYSNLQKPFVLVERVHYMGGTEYIDICRLSIDHAELLAKEGISWLYGPPDWDDFYKKLKIYTLEAEKKKIEASLADLRGCSG